LAQGPRGMLLAVCALAAASPLGSGAVVSGLPRASLWPSPPSLAQSPAQAPAAPTLAQAAPEVSALAPVAQASPEASSFAPWALAAAGALVGAVAGVVPSVVRRSRVPAQGAVELSPAVFTVDLEAGGAGKSSVQLRVALAEAEAAAEGLRRALKEAERAEGQDLRARAEARVSEADAEDSPASDAAEVQDSTLASNAAEAQDSSPASDAAELQDSSPASDAAGEQGHAASDAVYGTAASSADSWQRRLDKALLDVDASPEARVQLLQGALGDAQLREDLADALRLLQSDGLGKGHPQVIDRLWPQGTIARADIEGLLALRKQVPEVLADRPAAPSSAATGGGVDLRELWDAGLGLASDPAKQQELREELANAFRSTPKGLETPAYEVRAVLEGPLSLGKPERIELREYEQFTVARKDMESGAFGGGAEGFNALAGYLFGGNEQSEKMAMTMPVEVAKKDGGGGSMAFVLPRDVTDAPPVPLTAEIALETVPARLVAVKPFPGIVTDAEVERQRQVLLDVLQQDGRYAPVDPASVSTLQYNSPFTLPWRRRNEVALVVTPRDAGSAQQPVADAGEEPPDAGEESATEAQESLW